MVCFPQTKFILLYPEFDPSLSHCVSLSLLSLLVLLMIHVPPQLYFHWNHSYFQSFSEPLISLSTFGSSIYIYIEDISKKACSGHVFWKVPVIIIIRLGICRRTITNVNDKARADVQIIAIFITFGKVKYVNISKYVEYHHN